jgi:hypothetical protein
MCTRLLGVSCAAAALVGSVGATSAADLIKATIGQRGNWDTSITQLGDKAGIFKKHGIEVTPTSSWPDLFRPSTPVFFSSKSWMLVTSTSMTRSNKNQMTKLSCVEG